MPPVPASAVHQCPLLAASRRSIYPGETLSAAGAWDFAVLDPITCPANPG